MTWRNQEDACPTGWSAGGEESPAPPATWRGRKLGGRAPAEADGTTKRGGADDAAATGTPADDAPGLGNAPSLVTTLVWGYTWPSDAAQLTFSGRPAATVWAEGIHGAAAR